MSYVLEQTQLIPASIDQVWRYFATPRNLDEMTPPELRFRIVRGDEPTMRQGQLIEYRVKVAPLCWPVWLTEIRQVIDQRYFIDEQRIGPYRLWYHEHAFTPIDGGVEMFDRVTYDIGWGPLGWLLHRVWIRAKLERIFAFRRTKVEQLFGRWPTSP